MPRLLESVRRHSDRPGVERAGVWRHRRKDGTVIDVEITTHRMTYAERPADLVLAHDVTERLRAEAVIRENEERFRTVVESVPAGILAIDGSGRITLANRRILDWFGYEREELVGRSIDVLVPESTRHRHEGLRRDFLAHPATRPLGFGRDLTGVLKDGSEFPMEIGLTLVPGAEPMVLAVVTDVTEKRRAEAKTREDLAFRETLLEAIPAPVFYKDLEGRYLGGNSAFFRFVGWEREDAIGKAADEFLPDELARLYAEMDRRLYERPGVQVYEASVRDAARGAARRHLPQGNHPGRLRPPCAASWG